MTPPRIAPILILAVLSFSGCGGGCGRDDRGKADGERLGTAANPPITTTTAARVVQDAQKYRLYRPRRWDVGDVATREATTIITGRVTEVAPDGRLSRLPTTKETVRANWVEKAVDVDDGGRRLRYLVDLRTWLRTQADVRDEAVQGTVLAVSGTGGKRTWSFVGRDPDPKVETRAWLDGHFGSHGLSDEQWLRMMLPDDDVAVGESWSPDAVLLGNEMEASGLTIDRASMTATVTLEAIDGGSARCVFNGTVGMLRIPNSEVTLSKGVMTFEGEMSVPLEPEPLSLSTLRRRATLEGETSKSGEVTRIDFASEERSTDTPGGDFTEPER